ncbi:MAG: DNA recombination protein RmuC [bacterium]|nr:DNA recombination protein RmuC [bacterium]
MTLEPAALVLLIFLLLWALAALFWGFKQKGRADLSEAGAQSAESRALALSQELSALKVDQETSREELQELFSQRSGLSEKVESAQSQLSKAEARSAALEAELNQARQSESKLSRLLGEAETRLEDEAKARKEQFERLEEQRNQLKEQFENLANRIFEEKHKRFSETSQEGLKTLLNPLREQLGDFKKKVEETHEKRTSDQAQLLEQIRNLKDLNQTLAQEAHALTSALKGESKTQGDWGELILERILEQSGLTKGREYDLQPSYQNAEGNLSRPDAVIHLPEGRDLVVDSKVSLTAFERFHNAEDEEQRAAALKEHLSSVKGHIKGLSAKNYQGLEQLKTLDFVLMFVPLEAAFLAAHNQDPGLFKLAFDANVLLASPSTLLVTLRTVANLWRYEDQNQNAREIAAQAGRMLEKFSLFADSLSEVGSRIGQAQTAYDTALKRFSDGRGSLVDQANKLQAMGVETKKKLPAPNLDE